MANGIKLDLLADTRQFQAGTKDAAAALGDVADALDDVTAEAARSDPKFGEAYQRNAQDASRALNRVDSDVQDLARDTSRAGTEAGNDLERGIKDGASDAGRSLDKLETKFKDVADSAKRETSGGGGISGFGKNVKHEAEEASEGVATARENIGSNLKEVGASFDGTAQGVSDGLQGLVAEVAEGFGPAGLLAGVVAAGAIGIIGSQLQTAQADSDELKAHVADLANELIDAGSTGKRSLSQITDELKGLATESDTNKVSLENVRQIADRLGIPFKRAAEAIAEGGDATEVAIDKTKQLLDVEKERLQQAASARLPFDQTNLKALQTQYDKLVQVRKATREAQKQQQDYADAGGPALERAAQAAQDYADGVQGALEDAGSDFEKYVHDGKVNLAEYNKALEDEADAIRDYQVNVKTASATLSQDALNYIESLGPKAAPLLQAYVDAPLKQKDRTARNWDTLGKTAGSSYTSQLQNSIPKSVNGPRIIMPPINPPDVVSLLGGMQAYLDAHPLRAGAVAYTPYGKPIYG